MCRPSSSPTSAGSGWPTPRWPRRKQVSAVSRPTRTSRPRRRCSAGTSSDRRRPAPASGLGRQSGHTRGLVEGCAQGQGTAPLRAPLAPVGEDARDAGGGRRTTGAACPARQGTGARPRRPGSGAAARGSRGGPSSRTRPSPRGQRSCSTPLAKTPQNWRNSAACTQSRGAVWRHLPRHMGYPTPVGRRTLRRVARAAQHRRVRDVERRTASGERDDVVDGQVAGRVGWALVARAPVAVLTTPGTQHAGTEPLPGLRAVEGVLPAAVGLPGVLGAAATSAAGDDTADRAQLHPRIVRGEVGAVHSPAVLRLRGQAASKRRRRTRWETTPATMHGRL